MPVRTESPTIKYRLGNLAKPLEIAAKAAGVSEGIYARDALAMRLGVDAERLPAGNPSIASLADERHSKKRWATIAKSWKQLPAAQQSNIVRDYCDEPSADTDRARLGQLRRVWAGLHRIQQVECAARVVAMSEVQS